MRNQRKQIGSLLLVRKHKERLARLTLEKEVAELRRIFEQIREKDQLIQRLEADLYTDMEDKLFHGSPVSDHGTRFTTFVMSINAARENLLLEKGLFDSLHAERKTSKDSVSMLRGDVKKAVLQLKKAEFIAEKLETADRRTKERAEEASIDSHATRPRPL